MVVIRYAQGPMERFRTRLVTGAVLMVVGFVAELVMLTGIVLPERPPVWFWSLILCIGIGGATIVSAFRAAGRDRAHRTAQALGEPGPDARG